MKPRRKVRRSLRSPAPPPSFAREFRHRVYAVVARVPRGKVVTYGQVAALAGNPRGARAVGWIAHAGGPGLPWQRVVNRFGGLARGYTGGRRGHRKDLERDGVRVEGDDVVDLARYQWRPSPGAWRRFRVFWCAGPWRAS